MISILTRLFIKDSKNTGDPDVRSAYGTLCSIVGVFLNIMLFAGKYFAGRLAGSIAITADAFNNLSDAGSSIVTLIGFRIAGMKPDREHPFGHGRAEYIAGFVVSVMILIMGFELGKSSVEKIISPTEAETGWLPMAILGCSVLVKLYMFIYLRVISKKISSQAMRATAMDSIFDCIATSAVLLGAVIARYTGLPTDGWCGLLVAAFILYGGYTSVRDTLSPLLGTPPTQEFVDRIEEIVLSGGTVINIHDLVVHDYGPGRVMISLHGEVPADGDLLEMHEGIDAAERRLRDELGCEAVIHMDPILTSDEDTTRLHEVVENCVKDFDESMSIHDFRIVKGPTQTNVIFDVVVPSGYGGTDEEIKAELEEAVTQCDETLQPVIDIDHSYVR